MKLLLEVGFPQKRLVLDSRVEVGSPLRLSVIPLLLLSTVEVGFWFEDLTEVENGKEIDSCLLPFSLLDASVISLLNSSISCLMAIIVIMI